MRIVALELNHIRNVGHGQITFDNLPSGGSMTGLYGQNGSGKTAVVDVIAILKQLVQGERLRPYSSDVIDVLSENATITAIIKTGNMYIEYSVALGRDVDDEQKCAIVNEESIRFGTQPDKLGRVILRHGATDGGFSWYPAYLRRTVNAIDHLDNDLRRAEEHAYGTHRSFIFTSIRDPKGKDTEIPSVLRMCDAIRDDQNASERTKTYAEKTIRPFANVLEDMRCSARDNVYVSKTDRGALATVWCVPVESSGTGRNRLLDLETGELVSRTEAEAVQSSLAVYNSVLPSIIPGLHISAVTSPAPMSDEGEERVMMQFVSNRGGRIVPFRCESEGVIRLTGMLSYLIHAYNDPDALVAVDEIDTGVYELLLGDLLKQMSEDMKGQLVFTAHNLRALETIPASCVRVTTTNPQKRYTKLHVKQSNNNRRKYLLDALLGAEGDDLYDRPTPGMFGNALYWAGHPQEMQQILSEDSEGIDETADA